MRQNNYLKSKIYIPNLFVRNKNANFYGSIFFAPPMVQRRISEIFNKTTKFSQYLSLKKIMNKIIHWANLRLSTFIATVLALYESNWPQYLSMILSNPSWWVSHRLVGIVFQANGSYQCHRWLRINGAPFRTTTVPASRNEVVIRSTRFFFFHRVNTLDLWRKQLDYHHNWSNHTHHNRKNKLVLCTSFRGPDVFFPFFPTIKIGVRNAYWI